MNPKRPLTRLLLGLIVILIFWRMYDGLADELRKLTWADVKFFWPPAIGPLLASFAVLVVAQLIHAFMWRTIAVDLGSPKPSTRATLHIFFVSSLGRYVPGKVWQVAGVAVLAGRFGMAPGRAAAASVFAQIAFLGTGLLFLGATLPFWGESIVENTIIGNLPHPALLGGLLIAAAVLFVWLLTGPAGGPIRVSVTTRSGPRFSGKVGSAFSVFDELTFVRAIKWGAGYMLSWVVLGLAFHLFATSFGAELPVIFASGVVAASYLIGYIVFFAPAGVGAREGAFLLILSQAMPLAQATLIAFASRVWFTAAELIPLTFIPLAGERLTISDEDAG